MNDEAIVLRVARGTEEVGEFYLSYVELSLKSGDFLPDDWGWLEGMAAWEPLGELARRTRRNQGKKRRATSAQRAYLRRCGFEPWRGMSNREAHDVLDRLETAYEVPPGSWIHEPMTEEQAGFLRNLGVSFKPDWTRGEACLAINQRLDQQGSRTL